MQVIQLFWHKLKLIQKCLAQNTVDSEYRPQRVITGTEVVREVNRTLFQLETNEDIFVLDVFLGHL